ncbi:MAG: ATP-binding cassette domain-containing protein [Lactobacillus sp.]|jgi:polar amino acid transport system ATP-binding protein|nr:ATP-binding cassette domain-containing protein [Lactobacillus sp.]MCI1481574.1 ATP-binding cassette domain-containing protein [Lactobacillus sp.]
MLEVKNLSKAFNQCEILRNLSFTVKTGGILTIVGPSGAGKTTLLRIIAGLETKDQGQILLDHEPVQPGQIGVVFQDFNLFSHLTVLQNVALAPELVLHQTKEQAVKCARQFLADLQMAALADQYPYQLSGGQKQRVAIARALAMRPAVLCYDEPTSALDPNLRQAVGELILSLQQTGLTQLIITHDMPFAEQLGQDVLRIEPVQER